MKKSLSLFLLAAFLFLCSFAPAAWVSFESKAGRYKVTMPAKPQESTSDVATAIGPLTMNVAMLETDAGEVKMFMSVYMDYPDSLINSGASKAQLDEFFTSVMNGAAQNVNGTVAKKAVISYKNYPGRHIWVNMEDKGATLEMETFLVKNRMYVLQTGYMTGSKNIAAVNQFFNSFQITP